MARRISSRSLLAFLTSVAAGHVLSCGAKTVDLGSNGGQGSNAPIYSTGIPTVPADAGAGTASAPIRIVDKELSTCGGAPFPPPFPPSQLQDFVVDSGRLYWLSLSSSDVAYSYYLRSCAIDNCASTLISSAAYSTQGFCGSTQRTQWMQKDNNQVYWLDVSGDWLLTANTSPDSNISAVTVIVSGRSQADNGVLYLSSSQNTVLKCDSSNCSATLERFAMTPPDGADPFTNGGMLAQDSDYLYLLDHPSTLDISRFLRVRKDINASFEILLSSVETSVGDVSLHGDTLYWIENIVMGRLLSCPKSGCVGSPAALMTGLNSPTSLAVDDGSLYVLQPPGANFQDVGGHIEITGTIPGRILKCPISGCTNPTVIYTSNDAVELNQIMVDDRFVYVRGNYCSTSERCGFIDAIPK